MPVIKVFFSHQLFNFMLHVYLSLLHPLYDWCTRKLRRKLASNGFLSHINYPHNQLDITVLQKPLPLLEINLSHLPRITESHYLFELRSLKPGRVLNAVSLHSMVPVASKTQILTTFLDLDKHPSTNLHDIKHRIKRSLLKRM